MRENKIILIADDDENTVFIFRKILEKEKFKVIVAMDGKKTLSLAKEERPDLILLDVMMPYVDGYQIAKILQSEKETEKIPIIIITAKGETRELFENDNTLKIAAYNTLKIAAYYDKPFAIETLLRKINKLLGV